MSNATNTKAETAKHETTLENVHGATLKTTIGRFPVTLTCEHDGRNFVMFHTQDGRPFGSISLEAARITPCVHLYESAEWMLGIPVGELDADDWCLTDEEVAQLHEWASSITVR